MVTTLYVQKYASISFIRKKKVNEYTVKASVSHKELKQRFLHFPAYSQVEVGTRESIAFGTPLNTIK